MTHSGVATDSCADPIGESARHPRGSWQRTACGECGRWNRFAALPIPHDCSDVFWGAQWRRPLEYLQPSVRRSISTFSKIAGVEEGLARLRRDVESGAWYRRHRDLLGMESIGLGYRLITTK
jgi:hypothetical protein